MHLPYTPPSVNGSAVLTARRPARVRPRAVTVLRLTGALALLGAGALHLQQYAGDDYRVIPTIGTLFLLNFIGATVLGLYLLMPGGRSPGRLRRAGDVLAALGGCSIAVGSLVALFISERTPLFGFMEQGYRLEIVIVIAVEALTIAALGAFVAFDQRGGQ